MSINDMKKEYKPDYERIKKGNVIDRCEFIEYLTWVLVSEGELEKFYKRHDLPFEPNIAFEETHDLIEFLEPVSGANNLKFLFLGYILC